MRKEEIRLKRIQESTGDSVKFLNTHINEIVDKKQTELDSRLKLVEYENKKKYEEKEEKQKQKEEKQKEKLQEKTRKKREKEEK